jgi:hypothetical protein
MRAYELAQQLNGSEYPLHISKELTTAAKQSRLVIVYGASDDLMEFEGAIYDEVGAYEGTKVRVDSEGLVPDYEQIDKDQRDSKDKLREYFQRENGGKEIEALWCKEPGISWTYKTAIPHEQFEILEDGDIYCRGIVFSLDDCK